jgi:hypothetical protein
MELWGNGPGKIEKGLTPVRFAEPTPVQYALLLLLQISQGRPQYHLSACPSSSTGSLGAGWVKMMGELVLNEVEGKAFFYN